MILALHFAYACIRTIPCRAGANHIAQNAQRFTISNEEYQTFLDRHAHQKALVPKSNAVMKSSYVSFPASIPPFSYPS